ncbi:MAG: transcriptional repressor NrdR, partial [Chlamydiae bacterium]|nr:transcriptional repressor NrdR [Chlamydiota bacterium]
HDESKVTDSRVVADSHSIRRRRECFQCGKRFTTFETLDCTLQVLKRDGHYEDFSQEKLVKGLEAACTHTGVSKEQVRTVAYKIAMELVEKPQKEVTSREIGEMAMKCLQSMDPIAYIRFACVYRRFKHVDELMDALEKLPPHETSYVSSST